MSDDYLPGAMVLGHSLKDHGTNKQLAALVTLDSLKASTIDELRKVYDRIIPVDRIVNKSPANLYLMNRPDLVSTFTKIALWRQTQYAKLVYIDADVVALRAPDELFNEPSNFAAVPDIGWPDCFNSGVLALTPNMGDYYALLALAQRGISFDGADQGLLNMHFRDWHRLSFTNNCTPSGNYQYVPAYRHFQSTINMVHYIGNNKPWIKGRDAKEATGVYEELMGRWWAVYDKHYRYPAYGSRQLEQEFKNVRQYVNGEASSTEYDESSVGVSLGDISQPQAPPDNTEPRLSDKTDLAEDLEKGEVTPVPTAQQRRYSIDWDPIHNPPPAQSRPEAANFPQQTYEMSADPQLFNAPQKYPEPPKNLYYEVSQRPSVATRPKPIFPWEANQPRATRVFADDAPQAPSETTPSVITDDDVQTETASPSTPTISVGSPDPLTNVSRSNAWDDMPEIDRYIANLPQNRRAKIQVLFNKSPQATTTTGNEPVASPTTEDPPPAGRRPSMKITDFPTEIERPSLPVTPAPVRRPSFWGEERDAAGDLPAAEGVPDQSNWNPTERLVELQRRQSEVLEKGPQSPHREMPKRQLPESAAPIREDPTVDNASATTTPTA